MRRALTQVQGPATPVRSARVDRTWRVLRTLAWTGSALTFLVLLLAAAMRLQTAGFGCDPWPACRALARSANAVPPWIRLAHRVAAMLVAVCAVAMLMLAFGRDENGGYPRRRAMLATGCVVMLAVLGRASRVDASAAIQLGNLLGGFALAGLLVSVAVERRSAGAGAPKRLAWAGTVVAMSALASGALSSILAGDPSCTVAGECGAGATMAVLVPWTAWIHRFLAVALTGWFVVAWYRLGGRLRAILTLTVSIQCTLGLWQSLFRGSLVATLIHHGISVLLLAGMLWITEAERGGALETVGANGGEP